MKLREIRDILTAEVITGDADLEKEIKYGFAADLLSDVLALAQEGALLITGFTNSQVVYAADLANLCAVVFIKGKRPSEETKRLADQKKMPLLTTSFMMFEACGILYEYGLKTCAIQAENGKKGR